MENPLVIVKVLTSLGKMHQRKPSGSSRSVLQPPACAPQEVESQKKLVAGSEPWLKGSQLPVEVAPRAPRVNPNFIWVCLLFGRNCVGLSSIWSISFVGWIEIFFVLEGILFGLTGKRGTNHLGLPL